ncbi:hypothetical protein CDL12_12453 [Handroanthus impetiginosus]|uniref:Pectinesterase inhibitor domain-containing protein n=1 Tax=Handroanthus impetiginosus TaxID=429701 RepID=A0A2G9HBK6_9LAMI|nr:hypothetical protein CDL12_12453 [Handroanthus impetiginosus]
MGIKKTTVSFSLALIATFLLISTGTATATAKSAAVSPFCTTANNKVLCTKMVRGAKTWEQAMTNAINSAMVKAKTGKAIADGVGPKLPKNLLPQSKASILDSCNGAYDRIIYYLEQALVYVKDDPTSLRSCFSSVSFWECKFGLEEFEITIPEVNRFYQEINQRSSVLLSVLEKMPGNNLIY